MITSAGSGPGPELTVIGFDTATEDTAVALTRGAELLREERLGLSAEGRALHTTALLEEVEHAVGDAGGWESIDAIAVGTGPGMFTGLRVGMSTARALGLSSGLPVQGACSLDALGVAIGEVAGASNRMAVIDARREEVFAALYGADGARLWEPFVCPPASLAQRVEELDALPLAAGSGAIRFRSELANRGVEIPDDADPVHRVAARHVCVLAVTGTSGNDSEPVAPIYLRPPDAQRWRERDTSKTGQ